MPPYPFGAQLCQHPLFGSLRTIKYAPTSQSALNCKKAAQKSGFPLACARLLLFPTKRARFDPTENSFGGDPTLRRFAGTPTEGLFRALHRNIALSELAFERACLSAMALFRRRSNEQLERDVLRHDVILFGVEPLTNAHSFGDMFESGENFFGDGITRRSAKLAPWANFRPRLQVAAR